MDKPRICAVIVNNNRAAVKEIEPLADLFEVRIDLIGDGWRETVKSLEKPWIACNRLADEGGRWTGPEARRIESLLEAIELCADIVDVELRTKNLGNIVQVIKRRAKCLLSYHDTQKTPTIEELRKIVERQVKAGADIAKVVTTARSSEDDQVVLQLIKEFPRVKIVSFAMGTPGMVSRVMCPLVGGDFTYASIEKGGESAAGQMTVRELRQIYEMVML